MRDQPLILEEPGIEGSSKNFILWGDDEVGRKEDVAFSVLEIVGVTSGISCVVP